MPFQSRYATSRYLFALAALLIALPLHAASFSFTLKRDGNTSAGVYDAQGHLVRVLWTMQPMTAGSHDATWDGNDVTGNPAPPGQYRYIVAVNHSTYRCVAPIGNSGVPTTTKGHVPINFESVAVGPDDAPYTTHDWDEPHNDIRKWDPITGKSLITSGHIVRDSGKAIAVDGDVVYATAYTGIGDKPAFRIHRFLATQTSVRSDPNASKNWPIVVYQGDAGRVPVGTPAADVSLVTVPLLSLAVSGDTLLATDSLGGKVKRYDKTSGAELASFDVKLPVAIAASPDGNIWVGHEHSKVSVFSSDGKLLGTPISDLKQVISLSIGKNGNLYVADEGAGQVKIYSIHGAQVTSTGTLGNPAQAGDIDPSRFRRVHGAAVDSHGNVYTIQNEYHFGDGGHLAKFGPDGKLIWEQTGLEFSSTACYSDANPDIAYSALWHAYRLDRASGTATPVGNIFAGTGLDSDLSVAGNRGDYIGRAPAGVPRVFRINGKDYLYRPAGDCMQIFRMDKGASGGPVARLVSMIGQNQPTATGQFPAEFWKRETFQLWSWQDARGTSKPEIADISYFTKPGQGSLWQHGPFSVDSQKNIYFASYDLGGKQREEIWMLPFLGLDNRSNPIYDWKSAKLCIAKDTTATNYAPKMAANGDDGLLYTYGTSTLRPQMPQNGAVWMGGNTLAAFDKQGERRWIVDLSKTSVGLCPLPGPRGGCVIGGGPAAGTIYHYTRDGLLVGKVGPSPEMGRSPDNPSGFLDMFAAVSANRDPRDGQVDVFVEDNFNLRILWYRIDDRDIETLTGAIGS
ncbi:MAG TPA: FlgD immunoglobulin-like domain containing protein [Capsulimonadaceae bacterium]